MTTTTLYAPNLNPDTEADPEVHASLAVGWDLTLAVNVRQGDAERQVWSFDNDGNPLACLLRTRPDDQTPDAQLLAMCVPLAERFHPNHWQASGASTDGGRAVYA